MSRRHNHEVECRVGTFDFRSPADENDFFVKVSLANPRYQLSITCVLIVDLADEHEAATVVMLQYLFRRGQKIPHTLVFSELPCVADEQHIVAPAKFFAPPKRHSLGESFERKPIVNKPHILRRYTERHHAASDGFRIHDDSIGHPVHDSTKHMIRSRPGRNIPEIKHKPGARKNFQKQERG